MPPAPGAIHIGTSGWSYRDWRDRFYPHGVPADHHLAFFASQFGTVEVNATFYRLPERSVFATWRATVPPGFVFAVKASRYITHMKKLRNPEDAIAQLFDRIEPLGDRLGPILFQLPPRWRRNIERLDAFLNRLPPGYRYVAEFRDPTWFDEAVYALLRAHGVGFCIYDMAGFVTPMVTTTDLVYVRFHKPAADRWRYRPDELTPWAERIRAWSNTGQTVYAYFNNDPGAAAPTNAHELIGLLGAPGATAP
jgi:uncharacterized protein YecE (DUF72 family)